MTLPIIALLSFASCQNNNKGSGSSFSLVPQISDNTSGTNIPSISVQAMALSLMKITSIT